MADGNNSDNDEIIGLDKITDDDINSAAKNRAVDLTKVEKPRLPVFNDNISKKEVKMEIIKADDYGYIDTPAASSAAPAEMQLEKITDDDFAPSENKYLTVNQDKLLTRRKKEDIILKDSSEAAPADPSDKVYEEMARISKRDEAAFADHNTPVDLTMVTQKLCFRCGVKLSDVEKQYFKNKCARCYKRDADNFKKSCTKRYVAIIGLFVFVLALALVQSTTDNRALSIAFTVLMCVAVGGITVFFTIGFLAKKVGKNMVSMDYTLIALMALAASIVLIIYVALIYLLIAIVFFAFTVMRDQKRINHESEVYTRFTAARASAELNAARKAGVAITKSDGNDVAK